MSQTQAEAVQAGSTEGPTEAEINALLDDLCPAASTDEVHMIGLLQEIQERLGYLPPQALLELSRRTRTPLSRIYGIVSFYAQFYTEPRGRHTVRCCRGTACHVRGGKRVIDTVRNILGIEDGETTADMMFSFETVACLGACALSPVVVVDGMYYGKATARRIEEVLDQVAGAESDEEETN